MLTVEELLENLRSKGHAPLTTSPAVPSSNNDGSMATLLLQLGQCKSRASMMQRGETGKMHQKKIVIHHLLLLHLFHPFIPCPALPLQSNLLHH